MSVSSSSSSSLESAAPAVKICPKCTSKLPATVDCFGRDSRNPDGLSKHCRLCIRQHPRSYTLRQPGYVYLVNQVGTALYKIGATTQQNPMHRVTQLQSSHRGVALQLILAIPTADCFGFEKQLHDEFGKHRMYGEWFRLDSDALAQLRQLEGN